MDRKNRLIRISREALSEVLAGAWSDAPISGQDSTDETRAAVRQLLRNRHPQIVEEVFHYLKEDQQTEADDGDFLVIEEKQSLEDTENPFIIPPLAYLRAMVMIAWSAFRHPMSTTTIDLATGQVIQRE